MKTSNSVLARSRMRYACCESYHTNMVPGYGRKPGKDPSEGERPCCLDAQSVGRLRFGTMSAEGVLMKVVKVSTVDGLVLVPASLGSMRAHVYDFLTVACLT